MNMAEVEVVHSSDELPKAENKQLNETEEAVAMLRSVDKHYLANKWTLWFYEKKSNVWEEDIHEISSFDTVEDFWCLFNHIKRPSQLSWHSQYSYFKYGIKPNWDDEKNSAGGRWLLQLPPLKKCTRVDEYWKQIIMSIIGEVYESSEINGAIVSVRNLGTKISVWTSNASKKNANNIMAIGMKIKEVLGAQRTILYYEAHTDTANKRGSHSKKLFMI
ncbi:eukaryotic translation initiation factor 4E-1A-like [Acyrthosiphon pisum]|uniref:EIF-4F 25 kDa subunit n=1 Tax=Acyrthosiphon pisum TaxID=7029 RepID=A0A8R1W001_ACYPI|nr:eukaryotic translation initiation factor 4E-1A-like [Acyrthosiphon pisum]|eukprot:XP_001945775.2 PREDICTED: eukaryotic translation initiation factor 4E-1A-like [Acyrthosiphon pisum]